MILLEASARILTASDGGATMSNDEVIQVMREILAECKALTLATVSDGQPWATSMFFASEGMNVYCIIEDRGEGMANLKKNPNVALAVDDRTPNSFVQAAGEANIVQGDEDTKWRKLVLDKVPEYKQFFEMVTTSVVRIALKRIHVTDVPRGWFPAITLKL